MKENILESLKLRPNLANIDGPLLMDLIEDAINDIKLYIHYDENEELPHCLKGVVKKIVLANVNHIGQEGLSNVSYSGVSTTLEETLSNKDMKLLRTKRRLPCL